MSSAPPFPGSQPSDTQEPASFESLVSDFERLWLAGQKPSIEEALRRNADDRQPLLIELVHAELELRLKAGEAARVEEYLQRFPELGQELAVEWDLIVAEYEQRARHDPAVSPAEYLRRFPHRQPELARWQPAPPRRESGGQPSATAALTPRAHPSSGSAAGKPVIPGYQLLGELGRGGMGIVYKAWQISLKRVVALKLIRAGAQREELARFRTEAEAVARLRHPGIVQIHEVGEADGQPYLTLEHVTGGSLSKRLDGTPWPARQAAELVRALAEAIHHAHQQGVVHRDLKPGNVLLGPEGRPLIGDFGLAKLLPDDSDEHTRTGTVLGTPCYMAPEQASGLTREVGPPADIHALGAILYELLTGRPPFRGESVEETLQLVKFEEPVPPRRLQPRVGRDLETVCLKCLRKQPAERYASAAALAEDLRRCLAGEPIRARPPSAWRRGAAWVRRRPVAAVLLLCGALLVATVIAGLSWHTARLSAALEETKRAQGQADVSARQARQSEYASRVRLADQSLRLGDPFVLPRLLDSFRPTSSWDEDLRAFEWWHLTPYRQPTPRVLRAHQGPIVQVAYSPDGRWLATVGFARRGSSVKVWDARTGKPRFEVLLVNLVLWRGSLVAFGPGGSGWLAVCQGEGVTRWDLNTGKPLPGGLVLPGGADGVVAHPDGRRLIVSSTGSVSLWDADKGTRLRSFPDACDEARRLCLSADGNTLARARGGAPLQFWDLNTGAVQAEAGSGIGAAGLVAFPRSPFLVHLTGHLPGVIADSGSRAISWSWEGRLPANVNAVAVSPDEEILATGHEDASVRFWDVLTRTYRGQLRWQASPITCLSFSPDGKTLAVGTRDGTVFQVTPPGRQEPDRLRPALVACGEVAFSPDGKSLAVAAADRTVKLIDLGSGNARTVLTGFLNPVVALAFAPDGRTLATRERGGGGIELWNVATGKSTGTHAGNGSFVFSPTDCLLAIGHEGIALVDGAGVSRGAIRRGRDIPIALAFARDGRTLVSVDRKDTVEFWDVSDRRLSPAPNLRHHLGGAIQALAMLPDGTLVTGEKSGWVRFWQAAGGKLTSVRAPLPHSEPVTRLEVSRDGQTLLTHGPTQNPRCWDLKSLKLRHTLHHYTGEGIRAALSPKGGRVAIVGPQGFVELWDCKTTTVRLLTGTPLWTVRALAFTPDGQTLVTACRGPERKSRGVFFGAHSETCALQPVGNTLPFWDAAGGHESAGLDGPLTMAPPDLVALTPDGHTLAAGGLDGSVWLWDRRQGGPPCRRLFVSPKARDYVVGFEKLRARNFGNPIYPEPLRSLAFSPEGRLLATASSGGTVKVWDCGNWAEVCSLSLDLAGPVWVAFSPAGDLVVPAGGQLQFLDCGAARFTLGRKDDSPAVCVAFTARGNRVAVAHQDRRIRLWDLAAREPVGELIGHLDQIAALAFSPDGKTLASGSHDRTVKLWSVPAAAEVASLEQHRGKVFCLAFAPDGTTLASGGEAVKEQGEVYLWRAPRQRELIQRLRESPSSGTVQRQPPVEGESPCCPSTGRFIGSRRLPPANR